MTELRGLSSQEVVERTHQYGLNTIPEKERSWFLIFLQKLWGPIPWMLEAIILLEAVLGKELEAWVIVFLLVINGVVSFLQEAKAHTAVQLLKNRLNVQARVLRDSIWQLVQAQVLVPDDLIRIRTGDIIPADATILQGTLRIDQSALTGESLPIDKGEGETAYAGSTVQQGEAFAKVSATGIRSYFGKTAEIMRSVKTPSHLHQTILAIVQYLIIFDTILLLFVFSYSLYAHIPLQELIPFSLLLLVAAVPVALPATYALATALGSTELAKKGVLVTHLTAIEEAASMSVLCLDKTGTLTENVPAVSRAHSYAPFSDADLITLAALASEKANEDPIDRAIFKKVEGVSSQFSDAKKMQFIPFSQEKKASEALIETRGEKISVLKGAPTALLHYISDHENVLSDIEKLAVTGSRVILVLCKKENNYMAAGLVALEDPLRATSKQAIQELHDLGIKTMMLTGDNQKTAQAIAKSVGISALDVVAEAFPKDKHAIIKRLQKEGAICGMTGDGVNDAPSLKQAEVGIATSNATDVARASASIVLTNPGVGDIVEAVKTSRQIYQRMVTYTLNKIIKTLEISMLLGLGLVLTQNFVISQFLIVLLLFTNDFITMSIASDRVSFSKTCDRWDIRELTRIGALFAFFILLFSFLVLFTGKMVFHFSVAEVQTLVFLTLVFTGQATVYLVRERNHFWHSIPSPMMMVISCADVVFVSCLAVLGIFMAPLAPVYVIGLLMSVIGYFVLLDFLKVKFFLRVS